MRLHVETKIPNWWYLQVKRNIRQCILSYTLICSDKHFWYGHATYVRFKFNQEQKHTFGYPQASFSSFKISGALQKNMRIVRISYRAAFSVRRVTMFDTWHSPLTSHAMITKSYIVSVSRPNTRWSKRPHNDRLFQILLSSASRYSK